MSFNKLTTQIIDRCVIELKKKQTIEKIQTHLIDPLIKYTINRLYPYIITISIIFILIFILALAIFYIVFKDSFIMK